MADAMTRPRKTSEYAQCGSDLVVQAVGRGIRWHCTKCDVRFDARERPVVTWNSGPVPAGRKCPNIVCKEP